MDLDELRKKLYQKSKGAVTSFKRSLDDDKGFVQRGRLSNPLSKTASPIPQNQQRNIERDSSRASSRLFTRPSVDNFTGNVSSVKSFTDTFASPFSADVRNSQLGQGLRAFGETFSRSPKLLGEALAAPVQQRFSNQRVDELNDASINLMRTAQKLESQGNSAGAQRLRDTAQRLGGFAVEESNQTAQDARSAQMKALAGGAGTALTAIGAGSITPTSATVAGGLGGLIGLATGRPGEAIGGSLGNLPKTLGLIKFTDPVTQNIVGKTLSAEALASSGLGTETAKQIFGRTITGLGNVIEDELLAKIDGYTTTDTEKLISFALAAVLSPQANDNLKTFLKNEGYDKQVQDTVIQARNTLGKLYDKKTGRWIPEKMEKLAQSFTDPTGREVRPDQPIKVTKDGQTSYMQRGGSEASGLLFGFEQDEEGNITYNPTKGLIGLGVGLGVKSLRGGQADNLIQEARKYKSADEFIDAVRPEGVPILERGKYLDMWKQANPNTKIKQPPQVKKTTETLNLQDKNDLDYLRRIFSEDAITDMKKGKMTNWRGENYQDIAGFNIVSKTPKTIEQQLAGKIKDYKPKSDTFYHGTSADSASKIMSGGFKSGSELPENAYRGGGYGKIQEGVSFAETPKEAGIFSTLTRDGQIVEAKLKKGSKVVTIEGVEDAVDLADYTKYLKKQGVDAVYIGGGEKELVVLNTKAVTPIKAQLTDIYNKAKGTVNAQSGIGPSSGREGEAIMEAQKRKTRGFTETVQESPQSSEALRQVVHSEYEPKSNKILIEQANQKITYDPNEARRKVLQEPATDENVAIAGQLIKLHDSKGETDIASDIADKMAKKLTDAGRAVQAASLYNKLSPEGVLIYAQRVSEGNVPDDVARELIQKAKDIKKLKSGSIEEGLAIHEMMETIGRYKPQSMLDKVMSFWKAGLLTAPTTTAGNIVGNTIRGAGEKVANVPATGIDVIMSLFTGKRSRAITPRGLLEGMKEGGTRGVEYFKTGFDPRRDPLSKFDSRQVYFSDSRLGKLAENYVNGVFKLMGAQDQPFYYASFRNSIAEQAKVEGINQGLKGDKLMEFRKSFEKNPPESVITRADEEARLAVFQNDTALGEVAGKLGSVQNPVARALVNFVAPFRGVPSSVATAITEWGPLGYLRSANTIVDGLKKGELDQRQFTQDLSKATLGTFGLMGLGSMLYDNDLMTLDYPTDQNERKLWELENKQPFSVKIGGQWRSLNYVQPFATIMAAGGEMKRARNEGEDLDTAFYRGMAMQGKALTEQSFLRGVSGSIQALQDPSRYGERFAEQTTGSIVPNILAKGFSALDPLEREIEGPLQSLQADTPLRVSLTPRKDTFGRDIENTTGKSEFFDPFRSQPERGQGDPLIEELRRLQDNEFGTTPTTINNKESFPGVDGKVTLTQQQQDMLESMVGPAIQQEWTRFIQQPNYAQLSDEEKQKELRQISEDVRAGVKVRFMEQAQIGDATAGLKKLTKNQVRLYRNITGDTRIMGASTGGEITNIDTGLESNPLYYMYNLDELGTRPTDDRIGQVKWRKKAYTKAKEILNDTESGITPEEKSQLFTQIGLDPADVEYYDIASGESEIRSIFVQDVISETQAASKDRTVMLKALAQMRREVNGDRILTDTVIKDLVSEGLLSKAEGTALKNLEFKDGKVQVKVSGRGGGARLKKIKVDPIEFDTSAVNIPSLRGISTGFNLPQQLEVPSLAIKNVAPPQQPNFQVKFNL